MKEYLLIFRDHKRRWDTFSPAEMQAVIEQFDEWNRQVRAGNGFVGAGKLSSDLGVTVKKARGEVIVDGPFCEAKEAVSGYYCVRAENVEMAAELAKGFPMLAYGGSVEVRELVFLQSE